MDTRIAVADTVTRYNDKQPHNSGVVCFIALFAEISIYGCFLSLRIKPYLCSVL
ncbi:hypothetical protein GYL69_002041 [Vibrio vulnificus]|nr:hypothetical protein [Vibrio vulnificus]